MSEKIGQLKMGAPDGKQQMTDCANTETLLRIIQSIPSPKVEPLKHWLASHKYPQRRLDCFVANSAPRKDDPLYDG